MLSAPTPINTKFLQGEDYIYTGNELNINDIHTRDQKAKSILQQYNISPKLNTYSSPITQNGHVIGYKICTYDYKPAAYL